MQISLRAWAVTAVIGMAILMSTGSASAAECNDGDPRTSMVQKTITTTGGTRNYWLSVPPGGVTNAPLLVALHALSSTGCILATYFGWGSYAIDSGRRYVVAYTDSASGTWDASPGSLDAIYMRDVVASVSSQVSINPLRVFVTGYSWGSWMAQRVACDAADIFASATTFAGGDLAKAGVDGTCGLSRGIAIALWHGNADTIVPIADGRTARDVWASSARDACATRTPTSGEANFVSYSNCRNNVKVNWLVMAGQTHYPPIGAMLNNMRYQMWAFFDAFPHP